MISSIRNTLVGKSQSFSLSVVVSIPEIEKHGGLNKAHYPGKVQIPEQLHSVRMTRASESFIVPYYPVQEVT